MIVPFVALHLAFRMNSIKYTVLWPHPLSYEMNEVTDYRLHSVQQVHSN